MIRGLKTVAAAIVIITLLLANCGKKDPVVATVGTSPVYLQDLKNDLTHTQANIPISKISLEAATFRLNGIINNEIIYQAALEDGFDQKEDVKAVLDERMTPFLLNKLYEKEVLNKTVKESHIRDFYKKSSRFVICKNIFFRFAPYADEAQRDSVRAIADSVYGLIKKGAAYDDMVKQFSQDPVSAQKDGMIGRLYWTSMNDPITTAAFSMKAGQVSKPVMNRMGYSILQVTEIESNETQKPYEAARNEIIGILRRDMKKSLSERALAFQEKVFEEYNLTYDDSLIFQFAELIPSYGQTAGKVSEGLRSEDSELLDRNLAVYSFGSFNGHALADKIEEYGVNGRFIIPDGPSLRTLISQWLLPAMLVQSARDRNLDQDKDVAQNYTKLRKNYIINRYKDEVIIGDTDFSEEEMRAYYQRHRDTNYSVPETRHVREIHVKDIDTARAILKRLKNGESMLELAEQYTERRGYNKRKGDLGYIKENSWGQVGSHAFKMKKGQTSDPIILTNSPGYSIIRVLDIKPQHFMDFSSNKSKILTDMKSGRTNDRNQAWFSDRKAKVDLHINEEVMADVFQENPDME